MTSGHVTEPFGDPAREGSPEPGPSRRASASGAGTQAKSAGRGEVLARRALTVGLLAGFVVLVLRTAWLCDDAFITMRTVEHFVNGRGLVWNVGHRVQVFTHPLWMLLLSGIHAFARDPSWTMYVASALATGAFLAVLVGVHGRARGATGWGLVLALAAAATSKAFVEYSTSGLENPMTHLLLAAAYAAHLGPRSPAERLVRVALFSALVAVNRLDAFVLVAPPLALDAWRARAEIGAARTLGRLGAGLAPLLAWVAFAVVYYGFPFPNTAPAKLATGLSRGWYLAQGLHYLEETLPADPPTALALLLGLVLAVRARTWSVVTALLLHAGWVVWAGGDFMLGRFLTPSMAVALVVIARSGAVGRMPALAGLVVLVLLGVHHPRMPLRAGPEYPYPAQDLKSFLFDHGIMDERGVYYEYTGLLTPNPDKGPRNHAWAQLGVDAGERFRDSVPLSEIAGYPTIGLFGYYNDPRVHVIDRFALSDPLLARLPVEDPAEARIGHFSRPYPPGFFESLLTGENHLADPTLARAWGALHEITCGDDLWSPARWRAIVSLNVGELRADLAEFREDFLAERAEETGG